jgi:hypothetical protein
MANKDLIKFIKEARKRGFDDYEIREPLLKKGWSSLDIEKAFEKLNPKPDYKCKNQVTLFLDSKLMALIEKRAKKNMLKVNEQIEDILRRSCVNQKSKTKTPEKIDDLLVSIFSRKK